MEQREELAKRLPNRFFYTKVVSRNMITDWVQSIRNLLGLELKAYTKMLEATVVELMKKVEERPTKWYRVDIEADSGHGYIICIYGEYE